MKRLIIITGLSLSLGIFHAESQTPSFADGGANLAPNGWCVRMPVANTHTNSPFHSLAKQSLMRAGSSPAPMGMVSLSTNWLPQVLAPSAQDQALITETASALNNNFDKIYRFVHDNIVFTPSWGFSRGAVRTLLDREGSDGDQSLLLVALLRAAGYPATVSYCVMDMTDANDYEGYDALNWLGVSDDNTAVQLMLQAGYVYPYWYSSYGIFEVDRFIVVATDGTGTTQQLDPAFKPRTITPPRAPQADMGYNRTNLLTTAKSGATTDTNNYVRLLNDAGIRTTLNQMAGNLATVWHNAASNANANAFAGSDVIVPQPSWDTYYCHSYDVYDFSTDLFATNAAAINYYRTGVTVSHGTLNNSLWLDEMASRTVWLEYTNVTGYAYPKAILHVDDTTLATEATGFSSNNVTATISVTNAFLGAFKQPYSLIRSNANVFVIPTGVSSLYSGMRDRDTRTLERLIATYPNGGHRVTAQSLQVAGQEWLLQTACNAKLLGRINGYCQTPFYRMGIAGQTISPYVDLKNVFVYETVFTNRLDSEMLIASALEHGILNQMNGKTSAVSTVGVLVQANRSGIRLYLATSNNYTTIVKPQLTGYGTSQMTQFQNDINSGFKIFLPTNGAMSIGIWNGGVFAEYGSRSNVFSELMSISGLDGGESTEPGQIPPATTDQNSAPISVQAPPQATVPVTPSFDPVDLRSGACLSEHSDLDLKGPLALSLTRSYDSRRADTTSPLGRGWSLGPNIHATVHADVASMTGGRSPEECAAAVAACTVINDLLSSGETALNLGVASIVADWLVTSYQSSAVSVYLNDRPLTFIRRADGVYSPSPGTTFTLTGTNGGFSLSQRLGGTWHFDRNNNATNYVDPDGNTITYSYNSQTNLAAVSNSFGRGFSLSWNSSNLITSASGPDGRVIKYGYNTGGNLTNVTDAAGMNWSFVYNASNCLVAIIDPEGWLVCSNSYNALNQVTNQLYATGQRWTFRNAASVQGYQIDPDGRRTTWYYDSNGRPTTRFGADGSEDDWWYDGQGQMLYHDDPIGIWTVNTYDFSNNLLSTVAAAFTANAITNSYQYDSAFHLVAATNAAGRVTQYQWNAKHHLTGTQQPDGTVITNTYNANGLSATSAAIANGQTLRQTGYGYESRGFPTNTTVTDGGTTFRTFDGCGNVLTVTDPNTHVTQNQYDPRGMLTNTIDAATGRTVRSYLRNGLQCAVKDAAGHTTTSLWTHARNPAAINLANTGVISNEYDHADRLVASKDPRGNRVVADLDLMGRVTHRYTTNWQEYTYFDIEGCVTTRINVVSGRTDTSYDWLNRPVAVTDPLRRNWLTSYDSLGAVTSTTDPRTRVTSYGLDVLDRRTAVTYSSGRTERFGFDALGRQTTFTNSEGHVYRMFYDAQNRLIAATNGATEQVFRNYFDPCGNLTNHVDGAGRSVRNQFDALNRCTNTVYADGSFEAFTFDAVGNLLTARNAATTNTFAYDAINHVTSSVSRVAGVAFTSQYRYDLGGLATNIVYPGGNMVRYAFDTDGRLTRVTDWSSHTWQITRDAAGRMTALAYPNGISGSWGLDASSAVTNWAYSGSTNLPGRNITRDAMGLKIREDIMSGPMPHPANNRRAVNTFNTADRLTTAQVGTGTNPVIETYSYDGCGALTNILRNTGKNDSYANDLAGRMISATTSNLSMSASFDALGNRVKTTVNGTMHLWVIDHTDPLKRPLMETDTNGVPLRYYIWGTGRLLGIIESNGALRCVHFDEQGSVVALTDGGGNVTDNFAYGPYGEDWGHTGTNSIPFRWLGSHGVWRVADGTTLHITRHRAYDSTFKRFLQQDPTGLGGGANLYAYANGTPTALIDPSGLWFGVDDVCALVIGEFIGIGGQIIHDVAAGQVSSPESYAGSAIGGALGGWATLYTGPLLAGAAGGASGNAIKQYSTWAIEGQTPSTTDFVRDTSLSAGAGWLGGQIAIDGLNAGRNSAASLAEGAFTRLETGSYGQITETTVGNYALGELPGVLPDLGKNGIQGAIDGYINDSPSQVPTASSGATVGSQNYANK